MINRKTKSDSGHIFNIHIDDDNHNQKIPKVLASIYKQLKTLTFLLPSVYHFIYSHIILCLFTAVWNNTDRDADVYKIVFSYFSKFCCKWFELSLFCFEIVIWPWKKNHLLNPLIEVAVDGSSNYLIEIHFLCCSFFSLLLFFWCW